MNDKGDLISREALKEAIDKLFESGGYDSGLVMDIIDNAPTVCGNNPKWCESCVSKGKCASTRPQGEWIVDEDNGILKFMKCSNCGEVAEWLDGGSQFLSNFCPNCGADMRGDL